MKATRFVMSTLCILFTLLGEVAVAQTGSAASLPGPPYRSPPWYSTAPCQDHHVTNFPLGQPEAILDDAIADYEDDVSGCLGNCTFTVTKGTDPSEPYSVAKVVLGNGCTGGGTYIEGTISTKNAGDGGHNGAGEGNQPNNAAPNVGDPINAASGNKFVMVDDYLGTSPWLTFRRFYNSDRYAFSANVGAHWRHNYDRTIEVLGNPVAGLLMTRPDGSTKLFTKSQSNGQWTGASYPVDQLTETDDALGAPTSFSIFLGSNRHTETYTADGLLQSVTDPTGQGISLTYSTAATPTTVAPKAGLLLTVSDVKHRQMNFIYSSDGTLNQVTLPDQSTLTYGYNLGKLASAHYPDGGTQTYIYDNPDLGGYYTTDALTSIGGEDNNNYVTTSYDSNQRAIYNSIGGNNDGTTNGSYRTLVNYNSDGTSTITYPLGHAATMSFAQTADGLSQIGSIDQSCGADCKQRWKSRTYDTNGYPATYTDFNNNLTTVQYDAYGELTTQIDASGTPSQRTTNTSWNTTLRLPLIRTVLDESGIALTKTSWVYSTLGQPIAVCEIDPARASSYVCATAGTAPAGVRRWTYTYCTVVGTSCPLVGLLLTATGPRTDLAQTMHYAYYTNSSAINCGTPGAACYQAGDLNTITDAKGFVTTVASYDASGRVTRLTDANGVNTDSTYTPRGWLATRTVGGSTTTFTYLAYGAISSIKDPDGALTSYYYDNAHRLVEIEDALGNYVNYTLDGAGNKTGETTYAANRVALHSVSRTFNALGELTAVVDGLGKTVFSAGTASSYDLNSNLVLSSDALGVQRQQGLDPLNRLVSIVDNYSGTDTATQNTSKTLTYDALNRLEGLTDPNQLNTIYTYDGLGNRTSLQSPDTGVVGDTYDAAGDRLVHTDAKGTISTSTYDALNRIASTTYVDTTQNVSYAYDQTNSVTGCAVSNPKGRLTRIVENTVTTTYCYDARGNVLQKIQLLGTQTDTTGYTFTAADRIKTVKAPDSTLTAYTYDVNGRVSGMQLTPAGSSIAVTVVSGITWIPFGPIASYTLGNNQTVTRTYDKNNRLTDLTSPALALHFARDSMGNIAALGNAPGASPATETYSYDPLYRLTGLSDSGVALESYTYNETGDRLSKASSGLATGAYGYTPNTHKLITIGTATRVNDANGNTTGSSTAGNAYGFGYSARNRLVSVVLNGATVGTYTYNALGQRIKKVATVPTSVTERYAYDEGSRLIGEYGSTNRDYIWMGNIPIGVVDVTINGSTVTSVVNYIHTDGLGTPRAVVNSAGAAIWSWAYKGNALGEQRPTSTSGYTLNLRFPGQYFDAESAIAYNVNREYDATTGRYIESDPIGLAGGVSTYGYVGGKPMSVADPLGLMNLVLQISGTAVAGSLGGTGGIGIYVTLPSPGTNIDIGIYGAGGPAISGGNGGVSQQVGLVTGDESEIQGLSYNLEGDLPGVGVTAVYDADKNWVGGMVGPAEEVGGSVSVQNTQAVGLNDLGLWLGDLIYGYFHPYDPNCQ